jgi:hypothetical protein
VSEIRLSWEQLTRADNEDYAAYYRRIEGLSEQARKAKDTHETFKRRYEIMKPLGADDWEDRIRGLIERFLATEFLIPNLYFPDSGVPISERKRAKEQLEEWGMATTTDECIERFALLRLLRQDNEEHFIADERKAGYYLDEMHKELGDEAVEEFFRFVTLVKLAYKDMDALAHAHTYDDKVENGDSMSLPEEMKTERAKALLGSLQTEGLLTADLQPNGISGTERGLLAMELSTRLQIANVWQVFGGLWNIKSTTLRTYYNKGMEQKKSLAFQDRLKKILQQT